MIVIGEKINGTRKRVKEAIAAKDAEFIKDLALRQEKAGANYLDVNAGTAPEKEPEKSPEKIPDPEPAKVPRKTTEELMAELEEGLWPHLRKYDYLKAGKFASDFETTDPTVRKRIRQVQAATEIHSMPSEIARKGGKSAASERRRLATEYIPSGNRRLQSAGVNGRT